MNEPREPQDLLASAAHETGTESRSRTSLKNERVNNERALARLSDELLSLSEVQLAKLGASEELLEAVLAAKKIKAFGAKKRQARQIRAILRDEDWTRLRLGVDHLRAGFGITSASQVPSGLAERWCEQLLIQGDPGLARFCEQYEGADRGRLRQLIRVVARAPENKRGKARLQLQRAVLDLVGEQP